MNKNDTALTLRGRDAKSFGMLYSSLTERRQQRKKQRAAEKAASEQRNEALRSMLHRGSKGGEAG